MGCTGFTFTRRDVSWSRGIRQYCSKFCCAFLKTDRNMDVSNQAIDLKYLQMSNFVIYGVPGACRFSCDVMDLSPISIVDGDVKKVYFEAAECVRSVFLREPVSCELMGRLDPQILKHLASPKRNNQQSCAQIEEWIQMPLCQFSPAYRRATGCSLHPLLRRRGNFFSLIRLCGYLNR